MKIHRIYAIFLRHFYNFKHSYDRLSDAFYWPAIDLILWGLTLEYFKSEFENANLLVFSILGGILFWIVTWRGQYEISVNALTELWDRNMLNIFVSPLKFSEWITSLILIGIIKGIISLSFATLLAFLLYQFNFFMYGFYILPFLVLLLMSGWWIGFLIAGVIIRYGTKIQTLAWTVTWGLAPFSLIFYPRNILPEWAQTISYFVPMSYVFEGAREVLFNHTLNLNYVYLSLIINLVYVFAAFIFFKASFKNALDRGLKSSY